MKDKNDIRWTYESCVNESKKYDYLKEFRIGSKSAYTTACYKGWIKSFTWLKRKMKHKNYWVEKTCYEEAKKYNSLIDFIKNSEGAYRVALKNNFLIQYDWLKRDRKERGYWTKEMCYNEAKKYSSLLDFRTFSYSAYYKASHKGWIKEYNWLDRTFSCLENIMEDFLTKNKIKYEKQKTFKWLKYKHNLYIDFYLIEYNIAIECQGEQHFGIGGNWGEKFSVNEERDKKKRTM